MGRELKKDKQFKGAFNDIKAITVTSLTLTVISIAGWWIIGYIDTYYFKGIERGPMSFLLLFAAVVSLIGLIASTIAAVKVPGWKKSIYVLCALLTLGMFILYLVSVAFLNSLT